MTAINSMFDWYRRAAWCVAYLRDVNTSKTEQTSFGDQIRTSDWFTRCWTLQEHIAPSQVAFVDVSWRTIGRIGKHAIGVEFYFYEHWLLRLLQEITGIPSDVLELEGTVTNYTVAQRISWAANRNATRVEDVAYSLLGLFDLNMPLLYGEGEKAFIRLQKEILAQTGDESVLAWDVNQPPKRRLTQGLGSSPAQFSHASRIRALSDAHNRELPYFSHRRLQIRVSGGVDSGVYRRPFSNVYSGSTYEYLILLNCGKELGTGTDKWTFSVLHVRKSAS